jgi:hypothetical protein
MAVIIHPPPLSNNPKLWEQRLGIYVGIIAGIASFVLALLISFQNQRIEGMEIVIKKLAVLDSTQFETNRQLSEMYQESLSTSKNISRQVSILQDQLLLSENISKPKLVYLDRTIAESTVRSGYLNYLIMFQNVGGRAATNIHVTQFFFNKLGDNFIYLFKSGTVIPSILPLEKTNGYVDIESDSTVKSKVRESYVVSEFFFDDPYNGKKNLNQNFYQRNFQAPNGVTLAEKPSLSEIKRLDSMMAVIAKDKPTR